MLRTSELDRAPVATGLRIGFRGAPAGATEPTWTLATPWLGGVATEDLFAGAQPSEMEQGLQLYRWGELLVGCAQEAFAPGELTARTEQLYARVLKVCAGRHLFRVWNYVPAINGVTAGLENYRAFCVGRSRAFEARFGSDFARFLPAASAVGCEGGDLQLLFVAGEEAPVHFENPAQVPAYRYPPEHGPRSPSFARATVGRDGGKRWAFISGTSSIRGHETIAPDTLEGQLDCTLENLRLVAEAAGLGATLEAEPVMRRYFKIYLRHARDFAAVRARLERALLRPEDRAIYLQADICRAALNVEIEATLVG